MPPLHPRFTAGLKFLTLLLSAVSAHAQLNTYYIPPEQPDIIGEIRRVKTRADDTLMDIARLHGVGYEDVHRANPEVSVLVPGENTEVIVPAQFLLPDAPRQGIVLNRGEMRLYYYHPEPSTGELLVTTYPIGVGRADRQTPTGLGHITMKLDKPAWYPTDNVRADYAARGEILPAMVPPGPENPLGDYAMVVSLPGILIHGTNKPDGVGRRVSQGCIRLYPEHIEALVKAVAKGTPVTIVDQSEKAAVVNGKVVVEVHPPVYPEEDRGGPSAEQRLIKRITQLHDEAGEKLTGQVDWERLTSVVQRADGIPTVVSY